MTDISDFKVGEEVEIRFKGVIEGVDDVEDPRFLVKDCEHKANLWYHSDQLKKLSATQQDEDYLRYLIKSHGEEIERLRSEKEALEEKLAALLLEPAPPVTVVDGGVGYSVRNLPTQSALTEQEIAQIAMELFKFENLHNYAHWVEEVRKAHNMIETKQPENT